MLCAFSCSPTTARKLRSFDPDRGCKLGTWLGAGDAHPRTIFGRSIRKIPRNAGISEGRSSRAKTPDPADVTLERERMRHMDSVLSASPRRMREFVTLYSAKASTLTKWHACMGISVKTVILEEAQIQRRLESLVRENRLAA